MNRGGFFLAFDSADDSFDQKDFFRSVLVEYFNLGQFKTSIENPEERSRK